MGPVLTSRGGYFGFSLTTPGSHCLQGSPDLWAWFGERFLPFDDGFGGAFPVFLAHPQHVCGIASGGHVISNIAPWISSTDVCWYSSAGGIGNLAALGWRLSPYKKANISFWVACIASKAASTRSMNSRSILLAEFTTSFLLLFRAIRWDL
jgi:hypothetical protein